MAAEQDALRAHAAERGTVFLPALSGAGSGELLWGLTRKQQKEGASPGFERFAPNKEASGC